MALPDKHLPLIHYDTKAEYEARVAAMTTEERAQYNAFYLGFVAETREFHAKGNTYKCGREWLWANVSVAQEDTNDFVNHACAGDTLLLSGSELVLITSKTIGVNTVVVTAISPSGERSMTFTTSNNGVTWQPPTSIVTNAFVKASEVSQYIIPNTIVLRNGIGVIAARFFEDDQGLLYAMPYSSDEDKAESDYVLQEHITDLGTIRSNAAKGATAVQKSGDTMTGTLNTRALIPTANKTYNLGSSSLKYKEVHAERINADLLSDGTETYALPSASDTTKESATGGVLATEDTVMKFSNDLTGVPIATSEEFTFRPSAGDKSIRDESAVIKGIRGNTVAVNQLIADYVFQKGTYYNAAGGATVNIADNIATVTLGGSNYSGITNVQLYGKLQVGHVYLLTTRARATGGNLTNVAIPYYSSYSASQKHTITTEWKDFTLLLTCNSADATIGPFRAGIVGTDFNNGDVVECSLFTITDLTQMFIAGNEPATVEEFYERMPIGVDMNAYDEGALINLNPNSIRTNGFNQWDEQWELGTFNDNGEEVTTSANDTIRNKNYTRVLSDTAYYFNIPNAANGSYMGYAYFYDTEKTYVGKKAIAGSAYSIVTTPSNCAYMRFVLRKEYGTTYKNDICINLSHTGYRNGEYEPYTEFIHDLSWVRKYFPHGMRSAGSIYDEIRYNEAAEQWEAVQRVGVVDLGNLNWTLAGTRFVSSDISSYIAAPTVTSEVAMVRCSKYNSITADKVYTQNIGIAIHPNGAVWIYDSSYTDAASFKAAMSGVMLNYELAEPIITPITDVISMSYWVGDFGIEELISSTASAALKADIVYQFNAEGRIRDNERNIENLEQSKLDNPNGTSTQFIKADGSLDTAFVSLTLDMPNANSSRSGVIAQDVFNEMVGSKVAQFQVGSWILTPTDCIVTSAQERTYGMIAVATGIFEVWRFAFAPSTTSGYVDYTVTRKTLSIT